MQNRMVLFISHNKAQFVKNDLRLLEKHFTVRAHFFQPGHFFQVLAGQIRLAAWLLIHIWRCRLLYLWFVDFHGFLPLIAAKLLRKKTVMIIGGYEVIHMPELNYGALTDPIRAFCVRFALRHADLLLAVSDHSASKARELEPAARVQTLYNGVDGDLFQMIAGEVKQPIVLTVCSAGDERTALIKGLDHVMETARIMPETEFYIVGVTDQARRFCEERKTGNHIHLLGKMPQAELVALYSRAKIYIQLSRQESFCLTLAEAMACQCIPIVSTSGALPEIAGDLGLTVDVRQPSQIRAAIHHGLRLRKDHGTRCRERVEKYFSLRTRERDLLEVLHRLRVGSN